MMKGIVITPEGTVKVQDFAEPFYKTIGAAIGGLVQGVRPKGLPRPYLMAVNDAGLLMKLPFHSIASFWYGTQYHGSPIVGNIVLIKEGINSEGEPDWITLNDADIRELMALIETVKASELPEEPKNPPPPVRVISIPDGVDFGDFLTMLGFGADC